MKICLLTTQAPFIKGGAEVQTECLRSELEKRGHSVEVVTLPFYSHPAGHLKNTIQYARGVDLNSSCDLAIGMKFPMYLAQHSNRVMWIMHQHREFYDLWDNPGMEAYRNIPGMPELRLDTMKLDSSEIPNSKSVFCTSFNVAKRLKKFNNVDARQLYPPPSNHELFHSGDYGNYILVPSRIGKLKRQDLALQALSLTRETVRLVFIGEPDVPEWFVELKRLADTLGVSDRVHWKGFVPQSEKIALYAGAKGVLFIPVDEDMGYITMEALLSEKPVITCADSGGSLEFVTADLNGWVAEPTPESIALAMDKLWKAPTSELARLGRAGLELYSGKNITWDHIIRSLLA
jgi:glycosyltransferase involved in cell wall biosynthesis